MAFVIDPTGCCALGCAAGSPPSDTCKSEGSCPDVEGSPADGNCLAEDCSPDDVESTAEGPSRADSGSLTGGRSLVADGGNLESRSDAPAEGGNLDSRSDGPAVPKAEGGMLSSWLRAVGSSTSLTMPAQTT